MRCLEDYKVSDLAIEQKSVRAILLLESPHIHEVLHGHPLAGPAGQSVSERLVPRLFGKQDCRVPFGCYIVENSTEPIARSIAIVNCSEYPLDASPYGPCVYSQYQHIIDGWNCIRKNPESVTRKNKEHAKLELELAKDVKKRLQQYPPDAMVFPCGKLAAKLGSWVKYGGLQAYPHAIPHPSRNQWRRHNIEHFLEEFRKQVHGA